MIIVGIDPSLTCTGVALPGGRVVGITNVEQVPGKRPGTTKAQAVFGVRRLHLLKERVLELVATADLAVVEDYAFSRSEQAHAKGEWGGVLRLALYEQGIPFVNIFPQHRMMLATGSGTAKKPQVIAEARERLGYTGYSEDEADALWLREMALQFYQHPERTKLPVSHTRVLENVAKQMAKEGTSWPELAL